MGLFWCGAMIGGVTMFLSMIIIFAQAVDEKERQIKYIKKKLHDMARVYKNDY